MLLGLTLLIATGVLAAAYSFWRRTAELESELSTKKARIERLRTDIDSLKANESKRSDEIKRLWDENSKLEPYRIIADAEQKAREILATATAEHEAAKRAVLSTQKDAAQNARRYIEQATVKLANAGKEADRIVASATKKAEEIAGDVFRALQNATYYEHTAKAMKNVIDGYGDRCIVPAYNSLDEIADKFSFTEAGEEFKKARERSRQMVKRGEAAACDYHEADRKVSAVRFILDAFNGRIASILSSNKGGDFDLLQQAVKDAFRIVNHNGAAFGNTRVTQEFLDARLEELKWFVVIQELKAREKGRDGRIEGEIRDGEKSRREAGKVRHDIEIEEDILNKVRKKIQEEVERATEEQRGVYESRLQELNEKLNEAEERSRRALSVAQQANKGHLQVIPNTGSAGEGLSRPGKTRRSVPCESVGGSDGAGLSFELGIDGEHAPDRERTLRKTFLTSHKQRVSTRKEFFKVSLAYVRSDVEKMGIETQWTIEAAAGEWPESLAMERALVDDPEMQDEWLLNNLSDPEDITQSSDSEDYAVSLTH